MEAAVPGIAIRTVEPDQAREECGRFFFPHRLAVLHEPDRFRMSLSAASLGPVSVGLLDYSDEVRLETGELETAYEVNVPLRGHLRTWTGQAEVCATPAMAAIYRPDGRTWLHGWSGGARLFGLKIERAALEETLADLTDHPVRSVVPLDGRLDLSHGPGRQWWALASTLIAVADDPDCVLARPIVARPLASTVVAALLYAVDHPYREALAARPAMPRPASVREAVDLIEAEPEFAWTVRDLARRVGVTSRGLQAGFARHVGRPPMAYLQEVRLRRAHHELRAADPARQTVTDIAGRWGFTHLGRFGTAYRRRYGVPPSVTLRSQD